MVHLTNYSIQKKNKNALDDCDNPVTEGDESQAGATKISIAYLKDV